MLEVGDVIGGRLRIDRIIGVGGFGVVAAATHMQLQTTVAIKMLKPEFVEDAEISDRFLREARAVAGLQTEHVCRIFDINRTEDGTPYIVMELLQGTDLSKLLRQQPMPVATAVDYIMQALVALAEAHPRGVVHRDIKPANLFVVRRADGAPIVKVLDFGIAKAMDELRLTHSSMMLGSPQYMSPEQMNTPTNVDARTDIWSIGVTLYHLIARRLPFPSAQITELGVMIATQPPQPIDIDPNLRAVIWRCLEKDRARRFPDVASLATALVPFGGPSAKAYAALVRTPTAPGLVPFPALTKPHDVPIGPTAATVGTASAPQPAAPPAKKPPRRLWPVVGAGIVLAGGLGGYAAFGGSKSSTVAPAPMKSTIDAGAVITMPVIVIDAPTVMSPEMGATMEEYERGLLQIEDRIRQFANDPPTVQASLLSAVQMSCALKQVARAKRYLEQMTDATRRAEAIAECKKLNIEL